MISIQESIERLRECGFTFGGGWLRIAIPSAKEQMLAVMNYFVDNPIWLKDYDDVAEWLTDSRGKGLFLVGQCGIGKTLLATCVLPVLLHQNLAKICSCVSAYDLNKRKKELESRSLIIIDDVGVEDVKNDYGEQQHVFADVVNRAERRGDILILTTNLTFKDIEKKYGIRTLDRLKAITKLVVFEGNSFRKQNS